MISFPKAFTVLVISMLVFFPIGIAQCPDAQASSGSAETISAENRDAVSVENASSLDGNGGETKSGGYTIVPITPDNSTKYVLELVEPDREKEFTLRMIDPINKKIASSDKQLKGETSNNGEQRAENP